MSGPAVIVSPDRDGIAARALDLLIEGLRAGTRDRGAAHLALTGGSSAAALFAAFRDDPRARRIEWSRVHVWQGDERFVPPEHADSNWAGACRDWLDTPAAAAISDGQRHPIPVAEAIAAGADETWAAARYSEELERELPRRADGPSFDVLLLGVGGDGHILSTFPGTPPIREHRVPALAVAAPTHIEPHLPRVTLAPFLLRSARLIIVMVPGGGKADVVADCFGSPPDPERLPAQLALRPNAVWLLEAASAARLSG
jgi:6-phosphogluconolactonase